MGVPITHWDIQKSSLGLGLSWLWPLDGLVGSSLKAWLLVDLGWPTNALSVAITSAVTREGGCFDQNLGF